MSEPTYKAVDIVDSNFSLNPVTTSEVAQSLPSVFLPPFDESLRVAENWMTVHAVYAACFGVKVQHLREN